MASKVSSAFNEDEDAEMARQRGSNGARHTCRETGRAEGEQKDGVRDR